jgi:hypothetical protein
VAELSPFHGPLSVVHGSGTDIFESKQRISNQ